MSIAGAVVAVVGTRGVVGARRVFVDDVVDVVVVAVVDVVDDRALTESNE